MNGGHRIDVGEPMGLLLAGVGCVVEDVSPLRESLEGLCIVESVGCYMLVLVARNEQLVLVISVMIGRSS